MSTHAVDCDVTTPYCATISSNKKKNSSSSNNSNSSSDNGSPAPNTLNDSGNHSSCSASDLATPSTNSKYAYERFQHLLRVKDQALFTALQDLRKLRSKLDRLAKSEQWYKQELRAQKYANAEAMERVHDQERKSVEETRRLQQECARMYDKCSELRRELETKQDRAVQEIADAAATATANSTDGNEFQMEEQIRAQLALIDVLRKQKSKLLEDMEMLTEQKDETMLRLQGTLAAVEMEKAMIKRNYHEMMDHYYEWEERLSLQADQLLLEAKEKDKLHHLIEHLMEQLKIEQDLVASKEAECHELQQKCRAQVEQQLDNANNNKGNPNCWSVSYREELSSKTNEIKTLKSSLSALQEELVALANLQTQREQQDRIIDNLNSSLETRLFELDAFKLSDELKPPQIDEPQANRLEHERIHEELQRTQTCLRETQNELIAENNRYATMCALCETTRYELEMREIDLCKLSYRSAGDEGDIVQMRERLHMYLHQTRELSVRIDVLEKQLAAQNAERNALLARLSEANERAELETPPPPSQDCADAMPRSGGLYTDVEELQRVNRRLIDDLNNLKGIVEANNAMIEELQLRDEQQAEALRHKTDECDHLIEQLTEKSAALNKSIFDNFILKYAEDEAIDEKETALEKCRQLKVELQLLRANKQSIAAQLKSTKRKVAELRKAQKAKDDVLHDPVKLLRFVRQQPAMFLALQKAITESQQMAVEAHSADADARELVCLRDEVKSLRHKLTNAAADSIKAQVKHVVQLKQLLQQHESRETTMRATQAQWEELVGALQISRDLEENLRNELARKHVEFEQLNALLHTQNEQLRQLHESPVGQEQRDEAVNAQQTFRNADEVVSGGANVAAANGNAANEIALDVAMVELLNTHVRLRETCEKYTEGQQHLKTLLQMLAVENGARLEDYPELSHFLADYKKALRQSTDSAAAHPIERSNVRLSEQSIDKLCEHVQLVLNQSNELCFK